MATYSTAFRGYYPPDLAGVGPFLKDDAMLARFQSDFVYTVPPGTRRMRGVPRGQALVMQKIPSEDGTIRVLFEHGLVREYAPKTPELPNAVPDDPAHARRPRGSHDDELGATQTLARARRCALLPK